MGVSATNFGRSGVYDWIIQRVSAIVLAFYTVFLVGYVLATPDLTYDQWSSLFSYTWVKIFSIGALVSICAHAWVGLWTISTDYLTEGHVPAANLLRRLFQLMYVVVIFVYLVWGIDIIWSV